MGQSRTVSEIYNDYGRKTIFSTPELRVLPLEFYDAGLA